MKNVPSTYLGFQDRECDRLRDKNQSHTKQKIIFLLLKQTECVFNPCLFACKNMNKYLRHLIQQNKPDNMEKFI